MSWETIIDNKEREYYIDFRSAEYKEEVDQLFIVFKSPVDKGKFLGFRLSGDELKILANALNSKR